ncbi:STE3-domain-containing protein [Artomyces pyxidatus]|uniref:STE3-domain-containing protein n=1 Tax=Artomyces pyxidatus TaxID=48021 RepID=A0ACB8TBC0_9AGAM|nr:STE3-domain-containing protein [Artomyces pyxidatus]
MGDPMNTTFIVFAYIGIVLALIPFYWHYKAGNTGTCIYMFWAFLGCLSSGVNAVVWNGNWGDHAPVWCDITTHISVAGNTAIPASGLCITRHLYLIATNTVRSKRREVITDLCVGLGLPILNVALSYIVQGQRYLIYEYVGCWAAIITTQPTYPLFYAWPVVIGLVSAGYGLATMWTLLRHRRDIKSVAGETAMETFRMNKSLYTRLMILCCVDVTLTLPIATYFIYGSTKNAYQPWVSWAYLHSGFSHIYTIPAAEWRASTQSWAVMELSRWMNPFNAIVFFLLFGLAQEANRHYTLAFNVAKRVGMSWKESSARRFSRSYPTALPVSHVDNGTQREGGRVSFVDIVQSRSRVTLDEDEKEVKDGNDGTNVRRLDAPWDDLHLEV